MSEGSSVQAPVVAYARKRGCLVWKMSAEGRRDFPDLLILHACIWMAIECKDKGQSLRPTQLREQRRIQGDGGLAFDIDSFEQGKTLVDMLVDKKFPNDVRLAA